MELNRNPISISRPDPSLPAMHPRRTHLVKADQKGPDSSLTHILAELFKGLRDEPSTRAVAQKILAAIDEREINTEPCSTCGCDGNHHPKIERK